MMRKRCVEVFCLLLVLRAPTAWSQTAKTGKLRAGAAKVEITPKQSELEIATDTIRDPLFVRAIVVDNGNTCAVLVGMDVGGARDQVVSDALPRAVAATNCPSDNFVISATHTHSSNTGGLGGAGSPTAKTIADAVVKAAMDAKARLAPAKAGYGTTRVDLNVNRDLFNNKLEWRQQPNPAGPSDKTLSVLEFIGEDYRPIGVYMNYAMHPINFYLRGVISADFPGEASRYVEDFYGSPMVAIFSQGTSGDQNPALSERGLKTVGSPPAPPANRGGRGFNPAQAQASRKAVPTDELASYKESLARTSAVVVMEGVLIGESAIHVMRDQIQPVDSAAIWGGEQKFTCAGRDRLDRDNPARENVFPGYKEGADVNLKVGLLRIGDVNFVRINGEVYTNIGLKLKAKAPASKTIVVTLANGAANSGYIYSDDAYSHLTFQVIGSRLQPGCAEGRIISTAIDLMHKSGE
jgi:hypothetical protein